MHPDAPRPPRSSGVPRRPANADALSSPRPKAAGTGGTAGKPRPSSTVGPRD